ncbi:MAG TPA: glycosyltransferase [Vicinamibacterales bacterium]|nr:glycosyltransferase [Vicinamibacterales bacterium]
MPDRAATGVPADMEQLRILLVTSDKFPPFRPAAKAIFSAGLAAAGHAVDWVLQAADARCAAGPQAYRTGIAYVAPTNDGIGRIARLRKYWAAFRHDWIVFRLLKTRRYSLIQIKDKYVGALIAIAAAKIYGIPVFYWLAYPHGEASSYAAGQGIARYALFYAIRGRVQTWLLYRVILPACAHIFVQSEQMRRDIAREGIAASRMTAVPSSVELTDIDAARASHGNVPTATANTIVYLGTLLRERRLDFLVRVLALVRLRIPEARLLFVGCGEMPEDEALLRHRAEQLGVSDAVTITGWLPIHAAWEHVSRAAICVSPYYPTAILRSTSPTKLIEYMALGKAVVANVHPEQSAVLRQSGGGVLCGWDEAEFAEAIVFLLTHPSAAAAMGRAGRQFVAERRTHVLMARLVVTRYWQTLLQLQADGATRAAASSVRMEPGVARGRPQTVRPWTRND